MTTTTESRHPGSDGLHALPDAECLARLLDAQVAALQAVRPSFPALVRAADAAAASLRAGGRLGYAGAGSSGLMALADCLELAGTFGIPPERTPMLFAGGAAALLHLQGSVEDDPDLALADLDRSGLERGDTLLCLSASGRTPYALAAAGAARARGVVVVGIANVANSPLLSECDVPVLLDTGPEVVTGSTRMGAATAQKAALNMLSTLVAVRLGHVLDGYMINVVADNAKLVDRAARIVSALAGVDRVAAEHALESTGGAVKPAILVARGTAPDIAHEQLAASDGKLADLLQISHQGPQE
ncbi:MULTISPECIES: N-acetylmuramic acid 6-phosphate etherase [unclassified Paracoccus (in: a-proteobacteria)]|uniref:N-acetylmuramic acid 6-phosphate etherase n=1 Tax=unclassified Paracoccus (in: a-proteobacteria) TaxID=2688777 RepID=UPI0012B18BDD|nr:MULTISPECIES: N-acetylmuramic acid 6-phosphate etherase [unclassified Paracoccus (in: a-proteobacteria)]UXU74213.1 N-acetylmuramic acid 6-phosphate etherase [Paracoccus sp. SMMA_5]UXU80102.1 N-acetylmuramic acid 6-phosphate etherase [Paracoccus sp. SMMA_5_TC]